jgi:hypothetical protein
MWAWIVRQFPRVHRERVQEMGEAVWVVLSAYVRGIGVVATVDAVFIGLALAIIGVPLVLPLAVVTFFAAFFPIVGAVTAGAAAALVAGGGVGIGYAAHLAADACTPGGVRLWAPLSGRRVWLLPPRARIPTGSLREAGLATTAAAAMAVVLLG